MRPAAEKRKAICSFFLHLIKRDAAHFIHYLFYLIVLQKLANNSWQASSVCWNLHFNLLPACRMIQFYHYLYYFFLPDFRSPHFFIASCCILCMQSLQIWLSTTTISSCFFIWLHLSQIICIILTSLKLYWIFISCFGDSVHHLLISVLDWIFLDCFPD